MIRSKFLILIAMVLALAGLTGTVYAGATSVVIAPTNATLDVGANANASVSVKTAGTKVCAVEGRLVFDKLTCKSITPASGVMVQTAPTCAEPYFLIGIPSCATVDKNLMTVTAKAGVAGMAKISLTQVDIIGAGASAGSDSIAGSFTVKAPIAAPAETPTPKPKVVTVAVEEEEDEPIETAPATTAVATSTEEISTSTSPETVATTTATNTDQVAAVGLLSKVTPGWIVAGLLILAVAYLSLRKKENL